MKIFRLHAALVLAALSAFANQPNIVWISIEDTGPEVAPYDRLARTPNIARLAREGVTFLNTVTQSDAIDVLVDLNPRKHCRFIPGTGHEVVSPDARAYHNDVNGCGFQHLSQRCRRRFAVINEAERCLISEIV